MENDCETSPKDIKAIEADRFREVFKFYKRRLPPPNLEDVIEFGKTDSSKIKAINLRVPELPTLEGIQPVTSWKAFAHDAIEGFYILKNVFQAGYQYYWIKRCLHDFPGKPNVTNLDVHEEIGDTHIWNERKHTDKKGKSLLDKLRWATLGYHHDWNTKKYINGNCSDFPVDLGYLSLYISTALGFDRYVAQAAIINYYHLDSTLGGHTDHSEFDHLAPLISTSFGQPGIFLLGGKDKSVEPIAMFLHSGDVVIMSKDCRLNYHAVPKICNTAKEELSERTEFPVDCHNNSSELIASESNSCETAAKRLKMDESENLKLQKSSTGNNGEARTAQDCGTTCLTSGDIPCDKDELQELVTRINNFIDVSMRNITFDSYFEFLQSARINMNVRQVFPPGKSFKDFA